MLSLFPQILFLAPLALTILRVVAAVYLIYIAWYILQEKSDIERTEVPVIGHMEGWMVWVSAVITVAIAGLLFVGVWTQVAALGGMIIALKHIIFYRRYAAILPFPRSTAILLLCIFLTLVVSGAGAFAFDLPL